MFIVNPYKDHDEVDSFLKSSEKNQVKAFPQFFCGIKFEEFRHLKDLELNFIHPITVVSGSNKSGKTTVLLSIACSHYNFKRRNVSNGSLERNTWGDVLKFVAQDVQTKDWTYYVNFREGSKKTEIRGQRKYDTKKWNGVGKREGQIGHPTKTKKEGRFVCMIDLERVVPARHLSLTAYQKAKKSSMASLDGLIKEYMSYVFECDYDVSKISSSADRDLYAYATSSNYSSYNTASGEDAITRIIRDVVEAPKNALVLIEEIEVGLHPKIQRRLMDVLFHEASENSKQFIVTTHSPTILSAVKPESRIFIENENGRQRVISKISISSALTKMDSHNYPLLNLYVEDDLSEKMVRKAITELEKKNQGISKLVKIVVSGSSEHIYPFFKMRKKLFDYESVNSGFACILDGDKREKYSSEDLLFFHYSNLSPEAMLVTEYLKKFPNDQLKFHLKSSDNHCLFDKMVEWNLALTKDEAFEKCWKCLMQESYGKKYLKEMQQFIDQACKHFSENF